MQGPLTKTQWGQVWARAFVDGGFKDTLERSPQDAAKIKMGEEVKPLMDTSDPDSWIRFFYNTFKNKFRKQEQEKIRDDQFDKTDPRWDDLKQKLKGNQFFL